ncbi:MAG: type II toxin-antitoxin system prevent-host-death family antitoxin [Acidobacteria bacterium]|nr:type II toxin-antitoxin system prevent-host-death family antitoxin [Acidobacteriota bacterium]
MPRTLTVTEMSRKFADYINRVAYRGERFVLTRGNKPVAEIRPLPRGVTGAELRDILTSGPHLDPNDVEQFAEDIEDARAELNSIEMRDPWEA